MRELKYKNDKGEITSVNGSEFVKSDTNGNDIFLGDTVIDYLGDNYIVIWDETTCAYRLKSSEIYGGSKPITGNLTLAGNDHKFKEPESINERSRTPTSDRFSKEASKTALRSMGLRDC